MENFFISYNGNLAAARQKSHNQQNDLYAQQ